MTAFEVRYLHRAVTAENPVAWVPVVYGMLAAIACLMGMGKEGPLRLLAGIILALSLPIAGVGYWNHTRENPNALQQMLSTSPSQRVSEEEGEEHRGGEKAEEEPPALAPLSMGGLGVIGLVLCWPSRKRS